MIVKGKMSKNYVKKPEVQNSPEFRQYIRNLHLMVEHCMGDLYKIKHELSFASEEMKTMPKDGLCDIKKCLRIYQTNLVKLVICQRICQTSEDAFTLGKKLQKSHPMLIGIKKKLHETGEKIKK